MKTGTLDAVSNLATWRDTIELYDDEDGEPFDTDEIDEVAVRLRDTETGSTALELTIGDGVTQVGDDEDGTFEFVFTANQMSGLDPKTYEFGVLITHEDGDVTQAILGRVPVVEGL